MVKLSKSSRSISVSVLTVLITLIIAMATSAQSDVARTRNNPYAPSPSGKTKQAIPNLSQTAGETDIAFVTPAKPNVDLESRGEKAALPVASYPAKDITPASPTDIYKVGTNDVLHIKLQNADGSSGYYTVRSDGTIDFPLAGEIVSVAGKSVHEIEALLRQSIKLFPDPRPEVKIRDFASHKVTVSGSVANPGEKNLQREAVPFFVIKAGAMVLPEATAVKITPAGQSTLTFDLGNAGLDDMLIFPGTTVEFLATKAIYYVTGKNVNTGERSLMPGLTLLQASISAVSKGGEPKKGVIRRRNSNGILSNLEFDLKAIKGGRIADPAIMAGDIIDISN